MLEVLTNYRCQLHAHLAKTALFLYTKYPVRHAMEYAGTKTKDLDITNLTRLDIPATYGTIKIRNVRYALDTAGNTWLSEQYHQN